MALSATSLSWRGQAIGAAVSPDFKLKTLVGWEELPNLTYASVPTGNGYGSAVTGAQSDPRIVTVTGFCFNASTRDALLASFWDVAFPVISDLVTEPLTITHGGLTLSADAQLLKASAAPEDGWSQGRFGFTLSWHCPDPLRYGPRTSAVAAVTVPTLGIVFPVTGSWVFPADPVGGPLGVLNVGTAPADAVFTLTGALAGPGVAVIETGKIIDFDFDLAAGDVLVVDTSAGMCTLNGEYRAPSVLSSLLDELRLPAGSLSTVQPLGSPVSGSPTLSVSYRPAYW